MKGGGQGGQLPPPPLSPYSGIHGGSSRICFKPGLWTKSFGLSNAFFLWKIALFSSDTLWTKIEIYSSTCFYACIKWLGVFSAKIKGLNRFQAKRVRERNGEGTEEILEMLVKLNKFYERPGYGEKNTYNVYMTEEMTKKDVLDTVLEILKENHWLILQQALNLILSLCDSLQKYVFYAKINNKRV